MGIFGRLLGNNEAVDNILDKDNGLLKQVGGWVDGLSHTEQEKSEAKAAVRQWGIEHLKALEPFKVVQRIIAFNTMGVWSLFAINLIIAVWYDQVNRCSALDQTCVPPNATEDMLAIIVTPFLAYPIISVVSLYMSGGVLPNIFGPRQKDSKK